MKFTAEKLEKLFAKNDLSHKWEEFRPYVHNAINIKPKKAKENKLKPGQSKIGGMPDLPKKVKWPMWNDSPLAFIAQINFAETKPFDLDEELPEKGIAYFFFCGQEEHSGFEPEHKGAFQVLYHCVDKLDLERREPPENLAPELVYHPFALTFQSALSIPGFDSGPSRVLFSESDMEDEDFDDEELSDLDKYDSIHEKYYDDFYCGNKLLGHPNNIQGAMESECEMLRRGLTYDDMDKMKEENEREFKKFQKAMLQWRLLLQVDSLNDDDMMWGDAGMLYFWIRKSDLEKANFKNVWMHLQSG